MNLLKINRLEFNCVHIEDDLWLLQTLNPTKKSLPLLAEKLQHHHQDNIDNIVASESEILIYGAQDFHPRTLDNLELGWSTIKTQAYQIKVNLEKGLDWELVLNESGKTKEEFKTMLKKNKFTVCMYGFRPGFLYLNGLKTPYQVPRRKNPRQKVVAGSLAIGGKYIGIYGTGAPAGWNIIGSTDFTFTNEKSINQLPSINQEIKFRFEN